MRNHFLKLMRQSFENRWQDRKISSFHMAIFFRQLSVLLTSGIPILQCCDLLNQAEKHHGLKNFIDQLKKEIASGKTLAMSLRQFPEYFDTLICHLIYTGEQTGSLTLVLNRIATEKEKWIAFKKQLIQILLYPGITFLVAILVSVIMLTTIVPHFEDLFHSTQGELPLFTRIIIYLSRFFRKHAWIASMPILIGFLFNYFLTHSAYIKKQFDYFILKLPGLNLFIKKIFLLKITKNLNLTCKAGIPLTDALRFISQANGNYHYEKAMTRLQAQVSAGQPLHHAMRTNPLFLPLFIQMIKIGEESGKLAVMLEKVSALYEADIAHLASNINTLLEPLIMIILGALIGGLVIAMYLPIFKLGAVI